MNYMQESEYSDPEGTATKVGVAGYLSFEAAHGELPNIVPVNPTIQPQEIWRLTTETTKMPSSILNLQFPPYRAPWLKLRTLQALSR